MVCLDSSVIVDILKGKMQLTEFISSLGEDEFIFLPSPVIIEIIRGLHLKRNLNHIKNNEKDIINNLLSSFQVLSLDKESAIKTGELEAELKNRGELIDIEDIMIAAISIDNGEKLVTKNIKHFERIKGLEVIGY